MFAGDLVQVLQRHGICKDDTAQFFAVEYAVWIGSREPLPQCLLQRAGWSAAGCGTAQSAVQRRAAKAADGIQRCGLAAARTAGNPQNDHVDSPPDGSSTVTV